MVKRGDDTAGAVSDQDEHAGRAGVLLSEVSFDLMSGERIWVVLAEGVEADVDAALDKQRSFDPDCWVIEVEDREGRHLLDAPGLE